MKSLTHYTKGTPSHRMGAPTACRLPISGSVSPPSSGCFSPFPHGTCSLSVAGGVLRLGGWSPHVQTGFHVSRPTRVCRYLTSTGLSPAMADLSRSFDFMSRQHWPSPCSLATTKGVSVDVLSYGYWDVSVPRVRFMNLCIQFIIPFNNPPTGLPPKG